MPHGRRRNRKSPTGITRRGKTMMYDEYCFERWSDNMERDYLSREEEEEEHTCYTCGEEAENEINGYWYCDECAEEIREIMNN